MRTTINIPDHLYQQILHNAEINERNVSQEITYWMKQIYNDYVITYKNKNFKEEE